MKITSLSSLLSHLYFPSALSCLSLLTTHHYHQLNINFLLVFLSTSSSNSKSFVYESIVTTNEEVFETTDPSILYPLLPPLSYVLSIVLSIFLSSFLSFILSFFLSFFFIIVKWFHVPILIGVCLYCCGILYVNVFFFQYVYLFF